MPATLGVAIATGQNTDSARVIPDGYTSGHGDAYSQPWLEPSAQREVGHVPGDEGEPVLSRRYRDQAVVREAPARAPGALPDRWREVERAWGAIEPMFWGKRIPLMVCANTIRGLIRSL